MSDRPEEREAHWQEAVDWIVKHLRALCTLQPDEEKRAPVLAVASAIEEGAIASMRKVYPLASPAGDPGSEAFGWVEILAAIGDFGVNPDESNKEALKRAIAVYGDRRLAHYRARRAERGREPEPSVTLAVARAAVEAASEVIGRCDCIMAEMPDQDPKRAWYSARDAFRAAALRVRAPKEPVPMALSALREAVARLPDEPSPVHICDRAYFNPERYICPACAAAPDSTRPPQQEAK